MRPNAFTAEQLHALPHWAKVAFLARIALRILPLYLLDDAEPSVQREMVKEAIRLAEARALRGGERNHTDVIEIGSQFFDPYDIDAVNASLLGGIQAAENTASDLNMPEADTILAIQTITHYTFCLAFDDVLSQPIDLAIAASWVNEVVTILQARFSLSPELINGDYLAIHNASLAEQWNDKSPVPPAVFGDMWPTGMPPEWPVEELCFRPRARIIRTIGDRLISGPEAAVIELVKNSHDADATYVRVTFHPPLDGTEGKIVIDDDGHGMTRSDIERKWMEPATTDKRDRKTSPKGRILLGSKGIGRFAAARLGKVLKLVSTAEVISASESTARIHQRTVIDSINWEAFESAEYLDQMRIPATTSLSTEPPGTSLHISLLRDDWSESTIRALHYELRRLVSPIREPGDTFRMLLDVSRCSVDNSSFDGPELLRELSSRSVNRASLDELTEVHPFPLLDASDYRVDGIFDENGHFDGTMTIARAGQEPERVSIGIPISEEEGESQCGIVVVNLYVFDREAEAIRQTAAKAGFGTVGIREARKLIDNICGVAIYRSGFRIRPYGDPRNDWLTLDTKRVQNPSQKIGHNQISGIITVEEEETSGLIERSSREGLEENGAFRRLHKLISNLLSEVVEPRRRAFRISAGIEAKKGLRFLDVYKKGEMTWSQSLIEKLPETDRKAAAEMIAKESNELTAYLKRMEEHQAILEARVTAGLIVGEVMHQGNTPLSFLEDESARLTRWWPEIIGSTTEALAKRDQVPRVLNGLNSSAGKLRELFDALKPLSGARRGRPKDFDVVSVIDDTLFLFRSRIERLGVKLHVPPLARTKKVRGHETDLSTALTNVIDNALHWLQYHHIPEPSISITVSPEDNNQSIHIVDNGRGIPQEFVNSVFEVGFTLKPNGTGLGLSIAREAIERSNGSIECVPNADGGHFILTLPLVEQSIVDLDDNEKETSDA